MGLSYTRVDCQASACFPALLVSHILTGKTNGACECAGNRNVLGLGDPVGVAGRQAPAKWIQMPPSLQRSMDALTSSCRNAEHVMPASAVTGQTRSMHLLICVMDLANLARDSASEPGNYDSAVYSDLPTAIALSVSCLPRAPGFVILKSESFRRPVLFPLFLCLSVRMVDTAVVLYPRNLHARLTRLPVRCIELRSRCWSCDEVS